MSNNKYIMAVACMVAGLLFIQPAMAISTLGKHMQTLQLDASNTGDAEEYHAAEASSMHHFLHGLVGPKLYLHLLQSDMFITLSGLTEAMWEKHVE